MWTIIDCHTHIGVNVRNLKRKIYPIEQSADNLLEKMDANGVAKAIVFPFPYSSILPSMDKSRYYEPGRPSFTKMYKEDNLALMSATGKHSHRMIPFPMANPRDKGSVEHIRQLASNGIRGVKLHPVAYNYPIHLLTDNPLTKIIEDLDLIVSLHIGTGKEGMKMGVTLDHALELAKAHPSIRFIFCHLGRLHRSLPEVLELRNVLLDTSGLSWNTSSTSFLAKRTLLSPQRSEPRYVIEWLVEAGYEDKLVWGSDEPYTNYEKELDYILNARIPEIEKQKILSENIDRLLGWWK